MPGLWRDDPSPNGRPVTTTVCDLCGQNPALGHAFINDLRYCHGDGPGHTCYEAVSSQDRTWMTGGEFLAWLKALPFPRERAPFAPMESSANKSPGDANGAALERTPRLRDDDSSCACEVWHRVGEDCDASERNEGDR